MTPSVSVAVKSWSIVGYVVLFYVHDGLIPSGRSLLLAIWVWVVSVLTVIPVTVYQVRDCELLLLMISVSQFVVLTFLFQDQFIDSATCSLSPSLEFNGALLYTSLAPHLIPALVMAPILIRCTGLRHQTRIRRDISSDYLAAGAPLIAFLSKLYETQLSSFSLFQKQIFEKFTQSSLQSS